MLLLQLLMGAKTCLIGTTCTVIAGVYFGDVRGILKRKELLTFQKEVIMIFYLVNSSVAHGYYWYKKEQKDVIRIGALSLPCPMQQQHKCTRYCSKKCNHQLYWMQYSTVCWLLRQTKQMCCKNVFLRKIRTPSQ